MNARSVYSNYVYEKTGAELLPAPCLCSLFLSHLFCLGKEGGKLTAKFGANCFRLHNKIQ